MLYHAYVLFQSKSIKSFFEVEVKWVMKYVFPSELDYWFAESNTLVVAAEQKHRKC